MRQRNSNLLTMKNYLIIASLLILMSCHAQTKHNPQRVNEMRPAILGDSLLFNPDSSKYGDIKVLYESSWVSGDTFILFLTPKVYERGWIVIYNEGNKKLERSYIGTWTNLKRPFTIIGTFEEAKRKKDSVIKVYTDSIPFYRNKIMTKVRKEDAEEKLSEIMAKKAKEI